MVGCHPLISWSKSVKCVWIQNESYQIDEDLASPDKEDNYEEVIKWFRVISNTLTPTMVREGELWTLAKEHIRAQLTPDSRQNAAILPLTLIQPVGRALSSQWACFEKKKIQFSS